MSINGSSYLLELMSLTLPPTFVTDKRIGIPFKFSALAFLNVINDIVAPQSHKVLAQPRLVLILISCRRHGWSLLTLGAPASEWKLTPSTSAAWRDLWWNLAQPSSPHTCRARQLELLCPMPRHDQQARFSFSNLTLSSLDIDRYRRHSEILWPSELCSQQPFPLFLSDPARVSSWSVSRVARFTAGCRVVPVLLRRRSDRSYLIAFFFSNRNFSRWGNLSVLSTSLSSRQTTSDHLSLILGGSRFSMTLTELVLVISRRIESLSKSR